MSKNAVRVSSMVLIVFVVLLFCTKVQNPFTNPNNASVALYLKDAAGAVQRDSIWNIKIGDTVSIGVRPVLPSFVESIALCITHGIADTDTVVTIPSIGESTDTLWCVMTISTFEKRSVHAKAAIQGNSPKEANAEIHIEPRPISILTQPAGMTIREDSSAGLVVSPAGTAPFFYQWYRNGASLTGATGSAHFIFSATRADTGNYVCVVKDRWGDSVSSAAARLIITTKGIVVNTAPSDVAVKKESSATFSVGATGAEPLVYQWYHAARVLNGKTAATLVIPSVAEADSGTYTCVIKDKWGDSTVTTPARLRVLPKVAPPNSKPEISYSGYTRILATEICSLTVAAQDSDPGQTLTVSLAHGPQGSSYYKNPFVWQPAAGFLGTESERTDSVVFIAKDDGSPVLSDTLTIYIIVSTTIPPPAAVTKIWALSRVNRSFDFAWNRSADADAYIILRSADTTGFIVCDTARDTTFHSVPTDSPYYYRVVAANSRGVAVPSSWILSTSMNTAPQWAHDTIRLDLFENSPYSINLADSIADANGDRISLQLPAGGPAYDSLSGTTWKFTPTFADSGSFFITISATDNIAGQGVLLTVGLHVANVNRPPVSGPQNLSTDRNTALAITLTAVDPDGDPTTIWAIDTQTTHGTLSQLNPAQPALTYMPAAGYIGSDFFTFKAYDGKMWSVASAKVTIGVGNKPIVPRISTPLAAQLKMVGDSVVFTVTINGDAFPAPEFAWYKDASLLQRTTQNSWRKSGLVLADSGLYKVLVSNLAGQDSSSGRLTMQQPPAITTKLAATTSVASGSTTPLSVTVNADAWPAPTFKWYFNNAAIAEAPTNSFAKTWTPADAGTYKVVISNAAGKDSSSTVLSVLTPPAAPVLTAPAEGAVIIDPTLKITWAAVAGASTYHLQVSTSATFADASAFIVNDSNILFDTKTIGPLAPATSYFIRIRCRSPGGKSAWSATRNFATRITTPPTLQLPTDAATEIAVKPTLTWSLVSGAIRYQLQVSAIADFTTTIAFNDSAITTGSATVGPLSMAQKYYWRVKALGPNSIASDWSTKRSFTTKGLVWSQTLKGCWVNGLLTKGTKLYAATCDSGIYTSPDNGATWSAINADLPSKLTYAIGSIGNTLVAGLGVGLYTSTDDGLSWSLVQGTNATAWLSFAESGNTLFCGSGGNGVYVTTDGVTFEPSNAGMPTPLGFNIWTVCATGSSVYAGTDRHGIYKSTNNGATWSAANTGIDIMSNVYSIIADNGTVYATLYGNGIYQCKDSGSAWTLAAMSTQLVNPLLKAGDYLYVGDNNSRVYSFTNSGAAGWTLVSTGIPSGSEIRCFTSIGTYILAGTRVNGMYRAELP
jgi:hypothetical protein